MTRLLLASSVLLALAGCDSASDREYVRRPGELAVNASGSATISVPADVRRGVPVPVTVTTQGGGCEQIGDTEVAVVDGAVEIRPYDLSAVLHENEACTLLLTYFPHTVQVTFPEAGPAIIRAVGEAMVGFDDGTVRREPQVYELGIVVR